MQTGFMMNTMTDISDDQLSELKVKISATKGFVDLIQLINSFLEKTGIPSQSWDELAIQLELDAEDGVDCKNILSVLQSACDRWDYFIEDELGSAASETGVKVDSTLIGTIEQICSSGGVLSGSEFSGITGAQIMSEPPLLLVIAVLNHGADVGYFSVSTEGIKMIASFDASMDDPDLSTPLKGFAENLGGRWVELEFNDLLIMSHDWTWDDIEPLIVSRLRSEGFVG